MNALIFSGGEFSLPENFDIKEYDLVIAADSGYLSAIDAGVTPDIFVGDFDSVEKDMISSKEVIRLYPVKDMTDTQEALDDAISKGAKRVTILGALGGRIDHTLANLHLLKYAKEKGVTSEIIDKNSYITIVDKELNIKKREGFCLSLIPLTDCTGVCAEGVFYTLEDAALPVGNPYGISNEFTDSTAKIKVKSGDLLVMLCKS